MKSSLGTGLFVLLVIQCTAFTIGMLEASSCGDSILGSCNHLTAADRFKIENKWKYVFVTYNAGVEFAYFMNTKTEKQYVRNTHYTKVCDIARTYNRNRI